METTLNRAYRYPETSDQPNGPLQVQQLAEDVDADVAEIRAELAETYYDDGQGGGTLTTSPARPTDGAAITLPAGTWDVDYSARLSLSISTAPRTFTATLDHFGVGAVDTATDTHFATAGSYTLDLNGFVRLTLPAGAQLQLRTHASAAAGGTQANLLNKIRARRVIV